MSQFRCQKLSPKGRRFTLDENFLFLSFLKQSPKGYRLFLKIFVAPSRKILINLLQKITFYTGINPEIMKSLKAKVSQWQPKTNSAVFCLWWNPARPCFGIYKGQYLINGFQDNGGSDRRRIIADKAMIFVARGMCKKWKQPICYYFNEEAKIIKEIKSCQDAGLNVKSIVCDQGSANIETINKLCWNEEIISFEREKKTKCLAS